jgi:hypothetical protein
MYETLIEILHDDAQRIHFTDDGYSLSYRDVLGLWSAEPTFVRHFTSTLASCPFAAFRWETPAVTSATLDRQFEFVLLSAGGLANRTPDTRSFARQLSACTGENPVAVFDNLGGDATLVVPANPGDENICMDLAGFTRGAAESRQLALWVAVGEAMTRRVGEQPVWLSTAGGGVAWVHIRLDSRPKYYGYAPYRQFS